MNIHLDALRAIQNIQRGVPPRPVGPRFPIPPSVPDALLTWFLEDLDPRLLHDLAKETVVRFKIHGYRPDSVPRAEAVKILKKRLQRELPFQSHLVLKWLEGHRKETDSLKMLNVGDVQKNPWRFVERMGFPLTFWLFLLSTNEPLRRLAFQILKTVSEKDGKLDEIVRAAGENRLTPEGEDSFWKLPPLEEGDDLKRLKNEVDELVIEKEAVSARWREENNRRLELEERILRLTEEQKKLQQAGSAGEKARVQLESKIASLEKRLADLQEAEGRIKKNQKRMAELEHELLRLRRVFEEKSEEAVKLQGDLPVLQRTQSEQRTTIAVLKKVMESSSGSVPTVYRGETLVLIGGDESEGSGYFETAKSAGLTLLYHAGRTRDPKLDGFLPRAWRVVVLQDDDHRVDEKTMAAVLESGHPYLIYPFVRAEMFARLLSSGRSVLERLR